MSSSPGRRKSATFSGAVCTKATEFGPECRLREQRKKVDSRVDRRLGAFERIFSNQSGATPRQNGELSRERHVIA